MKQLFKKKIFTLFAIIAIGVSVGFQSNFFEVAKQIDIYTTLFKELNMYYIDEINPGELTRKSINHMLSSLDPYTRYYDEQGVEDARIASTGEYGGIGISSRLKNKTLTVREIFKNAPAEQVGIKVGDIIKQVDDVWVKDFEGSDVSVLLNGLPGTKVKLVIERQGKDLTFNIERKKIEVNPVPYYAMLNKEVGYISFTKFNEKAATEVKNAFENLKAEGMTKLIIDVRGNPGGLLNEAVKISNFFIPKNKIVVTTKAKIKKWSNTFKTRQEPIDLNIPIAILINNRSASASEILAGSLQDYDRAVVIGERSFGKGLVQRYRELSYGTQMKLTISKYYTPSGRCIQELDYTNRDNQGNIPKFSDSGRKAYKTERGRTVYGGGGILPDVELNKPNTTETTKVLLNSDAFFNYATEYFYNNTSIVEASKFNLSQSDYKNLEAFLAKNQSKFETKTEKQLRLAIEKAEQEGLNSNLKNSYNELRNVIQAEKLKELSKNKEEILDKLTEEIVKRYYYKKGVYQQKAAFDKTIRKAVELLTNSDKYHQILSHEE